MKESEGLTEDEIIDTTITPKYRIGDTVIYNEGMDRLRTTIIEYDIIYGKVVYNHSGNDWGQYVPERNIEGLDED